ncbi:phage neck terminator protein [Priestia filamentosa]|uniref:phage neck terminator protein n=1 Tax=Priestia filamentosa TaxID=1402861 RepID=UPI0039821F80
MNISLIKQMIARIKRDTGISIIKGNTTTPRPFLPYGVYNITSPYIKGRGRGSITQFTQDDKAYEKRTAEYKMTISFTFFGKDVETTIELATKVHDWFLFLGESFILENNLSVRQVGNIQDRTTFLVEHYEYKHGFDVQIAATQEQVREIQEAIENISLGG